MMHGQANIK